METDVDYKDFERFLFQFVFLDFLVCVLYGGPEGQTQHNTLMQNSQQKYTAVTIRGGQ